MEMVGSFHEVSTNGVVFNRGNIEWNSSLGPPQFGKSIAGLEIGNSLKTYFESKKDWIGTDWKRQRMEISYPMGYGWWRFNGLGIWDESDVALYSSKASCRMAGSMAETISRCHGNWSLAKRLSTRRADGLAEKSSTDFWFRIRSYADFIGTCRRSLNSDGANNRADLKKPWHGGITANQSKSYPHCKRPEQFCTLSHWVSDTPMELGLLNERKQKIVWPRRQNKVH